MKMNNFFVEVSGRHSFISFAQGRTQRDKKKDHYVMMYDVDPKANDGASLVAQMQVIGRSFEGKVYVCHVDS